MTTPESKKVKRNIHAWLFKKQKNFVSIFLLQQDFQERSFALSPFDQDNCVHFIAIKKSFFDHDPIRHSQKKSRDDLLHSKKSRDDLPLKEKSRDDLTFFRVGVCQLSNWIEFSAFNCRIEFSAVNTNIWTKSDLYVIFGRFESNTQAFWFALAP